MIASETDFYVTGGTLQRDTPSYVERQADTDLYTALRQGEFCYVLTSRQMGKSSLVVRTAARLREEGVAVVLLELTALGQNLTPEQWYDGLLGSIGQELELEEELERFWLAHERLAPLQRWLRALREVVLPGIGVRGQGSGAREGVPAGPSDRGAATPPLAPGQDHRCAAVPPLAPPPAAQRLVICLDEIDAVRSLPFSTDEFFAAIRECYNRRSEDAAFHRLTFCLLGVASPSDLIQDTRTTPFNIGKRFELHDFTAAEAAPLARGIADCGLRIADRESILKRVLYWTGGHPYLTQRLCQAVAEALSQDPNPQSRVNSHLPSSAGDTARNPQLVDRLCAELFLSHGAREQDDNLLFVRERLLKSEADPASLLTLYRQVRSGKPVREDETNPLVSVLRLSGITRGVAGRLQVRNRIYARVFDRHWVAESMPDAELRRQRAAFRKGLLRSGGIAAGVVAVIGALALSAARERDRVSRLLYVADMNVAQQAVSEGNAERALELLAEHRPGKRGGADLRGFEWRYLWRLCQEGALYTFHGNGGAVWGVAYSPDGKTLAAVSGDGSVKLWDVVTRAPAADFPGPGHAIFNGSIAFSPDRRLLAVGSQAAREGGLTLWDLATRRKVATLPGPGSRLWFSPDGKLLAACDWQGGRTSPGAVNENNGKLWDVTTQQEVATFQEQKQLGIAFAPDGRTIALARRGSAVEFWDVAAKRTVGRLRTPKDWAWVVAFSPDGKTLATCGRDETVRLWDRGTQRLVATLPGPHSRELAREPNPPMALSLVFSPDGKKLATAIGAVTKFSRGASSASSARGKEPAMNTGAAEVTVWDLVKKAKIKTLRGHKRGVYSLAFAPDGATLATASVDGTVKLWSVAPSTEGTALGKLRSGVLSLAFSPDGQTLTAGNDDGTVRVWNPASRREVALFPGHQGPVRSVAFSPDGRFLASAGNDRTVRLWRLNPPEPLAVLTGHKDQVSSVAFSPNGKSLASGSADATVRLWDLATQRPITTLETGVGVVLALAFSPDGKRLALGTNEYSVKLWDLVSREEVASLLAHTSSVTAVALSPDGKTLASGSADHSIQLWDVGARQARVALKGCKDRVRAVAFSPDGRSLASGSEDGTVRLWNVATGREAARLGGEMGPIWGVAFSRDGTVLAAGGKEGGVRLWRAPSFAETDAEELSGRSPNSSRRIDQGVD